jgi:hypothetical protein
MSYAADTPITILPWPQTLQPSLMQLHLQSLTARFTSPLTRGVQTQELPGGRFRLSLNLPPMREDKAREARAWFAKLRGGAGRFYFRAEVNGGTIPALFAAEPVNTRALTVDGDTITADLSSTRLTADATQIESPFSAAATGSTADPMVIEATTTAYTGAVVAEVGQHISFDGASGWRRLHVLTEDAIAAADGTVQFTVEPPLREFPMVGSPLHLLCPSGVFMLADDDQGALTLQPGRVTAGITVDAIESYPAPV